MDALLSILTLVLSIWIAKIAINLLDGVSEVKLLKYL